MTTFKTAGTASRHDDAIGPYAQSAGVTRSRFAIGGPLKRVFDLVAALLLMMAFSPLFCLVALVVKFSSKGPVLYGHERVGHEGRTFRCWKFRTMVTNGDETLAAYLKQNPIERHEWTTNRKLRNDPRVTRIGAVLRSTSVDELPQLFNVLIGEMSLVGPRPVVQDELENYGPAAEFYLQARPGITGMWQVSGRSDVGYSERVSLDTAYIINWSFVRDIVIIAQTIPAVISTRGSY